MKFAQILENLMEIKDISAYKLSKDTGIAESTIARWRSGIAMPSQDKLKKLANYFGVPVDYLLGIEEKPDIPQDVEQLIEHYAIALAEMPDERRNKVMQRLFELLQGKRK